MARRDTREEICARLKDAVGEVRTHLSRVEIWTDALDGFSRPVPEYEPDNRHMLPGKLRKTH